MTRNSSPTGRTPTRLDFLPKRLGMDSCTATLGGAGGVRMKLRYGMVCSSNQNRSMEAHSLLKREGFDVCSYGTGAHVKLPGPSLREPNVYDFGTPYKQMFDDLRRKDPELYPPSLPLSFFTYY
ncbi:Ssu72-like family protein [Actinidia rufa]|uniref:RNA polymerase II subunit A C-terminal domain phosphatase SSU72 n=1 Tax=Actinidia rufa TaxID=165716 RepID=A0A7J0H121_9ERIC|nr:Ssu72-like family protein [Actinidia rufa]